MSNKTAGGFDGLCIAAFESRLSAQTGTLIEKEGGVALCAPSMQEIPLDHGPEAFRFAENLLSGRVDILIFMTGVGTRYLFKALETKYKLNELVQACSKTTTVARGPKPIAVMKELGIPVMVQVPEPNTSQEIIEALDQSERSVSLSGKLVAIQEYGESSKDLVKALKKRGAKVMQVPVYRWALPDDTGPLEAAVSRIISGEVNAAVFTSAQQIRNVLKIAAQKGQETALKEAFKRIPLASIGPTCSEAIRSCGLPVDFEPSRSKLAIMIRELAGSIQDLCEAKRSGVITRPFADKIESRESAAKRKQESVFLKACRREPVPYTPIWIMRQAGRYMADYRKVRNKVTFLELCKTKELVAEVTITAQENLGVDAAIIFSDILLLVEPFGLGLEYEAGSGPQIPGAVATKEDILKLREYDPAEELSYVMDSIRLTRAHLNEAIPLLGFAAAPFTLASYMIEGGASKNFIKTKALMHSSPDLWDMLMSRITKTLAAHLNAQIEAGSDAIQIFDSWAGVLSPSDYLKYVSPYSKKLVAAVTGKVPVIHFGTGTAPFLEIFADTGSDVIGIDYKIDLREAWDRIGSSKAVQGNMDPAVLYASTEAIREEVKRILDSVKGRPGHIFNLGHGILPTTPEHNAVELVRMVHELSRNTE